MMYFNLFNGWYYWGANDLGGWVFLFTANIIAALFIWADTLWRRVTLRRWFAWAVLPLLLFFPTPIFLVRLEVLWQNFWLPFSAAILGCLGTFLTFLILTVYVIRYLIQNPKEIYFLEDKSSGQRRLLKKGVTSVEDTFFIRVAREGCILYIPASRSSVVVNGVAQRRATLTVAQDTMIEVGNQHYRILVTE